MANIKSQIKRIGTNKKAQERNKAVKSELKTAIRATREAVAAGDKDKAVAALKVANKKLDKATSKGVIHANNAAYRKCSIAKQVAALCIIRIGARLSSNPAPRASAGGFAHVGGDSAAWLPRRPPAPSTVRLLSRRSAAGGEGLDEAFEGVDRVAAAALHLGIGVGEGLDGAAEPGIGPALQVAARAVDLPGCEPESLGELP
jgi:small subunit ribosomal protein S20